MIGNQIFTFTNSAWARNGNFLRALPLKPLLFLVMKQKKKPINLWFSQASYLYVREQSNLNVLPLWEALLTGQCPSGTSCFQTPHSLQIPSSPARIWWRAAPVGWWSDTAQNEITFYTVAAHSHIMLGMFSLQCSSTRCAGLLHINWMSVTLKTSTNNTTPSALTSNCHAHKTSSKE